MSDLGFRGRCTVVDPVFVDQTAANARADGDIKNGVESFARSEDGFTQSRCVGVIFYKNRETRDFLKPWAEGKLVPAWDMIGFYDLAGAPTNWATVSDAESDRAMLGDEFGKDLADLGPDTFSAQCRIHRAAASVCDDSVGGAYGELEFGAADFDGKQRFGRGAGVHG
jgi:hypothetical protein